MASTPRYKGIPAPRARKTPDIVSNERMWCCRARSSGRPLSKHPLQCNETHSHGPAILRRHEGFPRKLNINDNNNRDKERRIGTFDEASEEITTTMEENLVNGGGQNKLGNTPPFKIKVSPGRVSPINDPASPSSIAGLVSNSSFGNSNSLVSAGVVDPPSPSLDKRTSSSTLFEMMIHEHDIQPKALLLQPPPSQSTIVLSNQSSMQETILSAISPGNKFNDANSSDVKLVLSNKDGSSVSLNVHRHILASHSHFFAVKLLERGSKEESQPYVLEVSDCDDVELYADTIRLMYCRDLKRSLMKETIPKVLGILKVSATIVFEAGVLTCQEFLEALPWAEEDEEEVVLTLSQLQIEGTGANEVLRRIDSTNDPEGLEGILVRLVHLVTRGSDEKARRQMKNLVSRMLRENAANTRDGVDVSKESLYQTCNACLDALLHLFIQASSCEFMKRDSEDRGSIVSQIALQADNLLWLIEILIDRNVAEDFVRIWACQDELVALHSKIPPIFRYEVSRLTARLFIALGQGKVLAPKATRFRLLQQWLQPLIEDYARLLRGGKELDRKLLEEGISQTILTLPLEKQQAIMLAWFDRFLENADDCPNLQKAFEIWWRRRFIRPCFEGQTTSSEDSTV